MHLPQPDPHSSHPERLVLKTNPESQTMHTKLKSVSVRFES